MKQPSGTYVTCLCTLFSLLVNIAKATLRESFCFNLLLILCVGSVGGYSTQQRL